MRFLFLLFLAHLCRRNLGTIFCHVQFNTSFQMIFHKSDAMGTENKLHISKYLLTRIIGFKCRQRSYCDILQTFEFFQKDSQYVKMFFCMFLSVSSDFRKSKNFDVHYKNALKSISCIRKSSIFIHSNADKFKSRDGIVTSKCNPSKQNFAFFLHNDNFFLKIIFWDQKKFKTQKCPSFIFL